MLAARLMTLLRQNPLTIHTSMADVYHHTTMRALCRHLSAKSHVQSKPQARSHTLAHPGINHGGSASNLPRTNLNAPDTSASELESADSLRQRGRLDAPSASVLPLSSMTPSTNAGAGSTVFHPDSISIDTGFQNATTASQLEDSFTPSTDRAFWLTGALQLPSILLLLSIGMWSQLAPWAAAASVLESEWLRAAVVSVSPSASSSLSSSLGALSWSQSLWFLCIVPVAAAMAASVVFQIGFALLAIAAKWILIGTVFFANLYRCRTLEIFAIFILHTFHCSLLCLSRRSLPSRLAPALVVVLLSLVARQSPHRVRADRRPARLVCARVVLPRVGRAHRFARAHCDQYRGRF